MTQFPVSHALISEAESEARIEQMVDAWFAKAASKRANQHNSLRKNDNASRKSVKHIAFA